MQDMKHPLIEALKRKKQQAQALAIEIEIKPNMEDGEQMAEEEMAKKEDLAPKAAPLNTDDEAKAKAEMAAGQYNDKDLLDVIGADEQDMESGIENQAPKSLMERAKFALIKKAKAKNKA